ncbi:hypothetical protein NQ315_009647 [Exocentrus adspersus]|uniref:Uncharacterized protein n=1 Tax=Exocentrus adspersus TaxID=1586481 RepID=A0AAV8WHL0_9CUCU|nr:hypothetical protein NQ315_009647 [Exocentrus adspersus]
MVYDIKGKIALITGGAAGIGLAYSVELLKNGLGGVVIADVDAKKGDDSVNSINKEFGAKKAVFIKTDVTKVDQLEAAFKLAVSTFGTLDIVINNAGIMNDAHWELEIAINCVSVSINIHYIHLKNPYYTFQNAVVQGSLLGIKYMGKNHGGKGGVIVNIASILGLQELSGCPIYVGTKHFVVGLDRSFGTPFYLNLTGIRFLTMCPGVTDTPLISEAGKLALQGYPDLGKVLAEELASLPPQPTPAPYNAPPPPFLKREFSEDNPKSPVKCKVAIVTGGARGIGYHISDHLLKAGARAVILGDILNDEMEEATCKLNEKYGEDKALFQPCDVTKKEDLEKIFQCTKDRFGQLDIVVNNAGVADSDWEKMVDINVKGVVYGTLLGFQHMGVNNGGKGGHIINVSSILGLQPSFSLPVYSGTKWFIIGWTKSVGSEYFCNKTKVKVMAVCPGVTHTEIIKNAGHMQLTGFPELGEEAAGSLAALPPQGPEEVGRSVVEMLQDGENGSAWVSEGCETYKANMPDRSTYKPMDMEGSSGGSGSQCSDCSNDSDDSKPRRYGGNTSKGKCKEDSCKQKLKKDKYVLQGGVNGDVLDLDGVQPGGLNKPLPPYGDDEDLLYYYTDANHEPDKCKDKNKSSCDKKDPCKRERCKNYDEKPPCKQKKKKSK